MQFTIVDCEFQQMGHVTNTYTHYCFYALFFGVFIFSFCMDKPFFKHILNVNVYLIFSLFFWYHFTFFLICIALALNACMTGLICDWLFSLVFYAFTIIKKPHHSFRLSQYVMRIILISSSFSFIYLLWFSKEFVTHSHWTKSVTNQSHKRLNPCKIFTKYKSICLNCFSIFLFWRCSEINRLLSSARGAMRSFFSASDEIHLIMKPLFQFGFFFSFLFFLATKNVNFLWWVRSICVDMTKWIGCHNDRYILILFICNMVQSVNVNFHLENLSIDCRIVIVWSTIPMSITCTSHSH